MPKGDPKFPQRLHFMLPLEDRQKLYALAYMRFDGNLSSCSRVLVTNALRAYIENLSVDDQREFKYILERAKIIAQEEEG